MSAVEAIPTALWLDYLDHWLFRELQGLGYRAELMNSTIHHELSIIDSTPPDPTRLINMLKAERLFVARLGFRARAMYPVRIVLRAARALPHDGRAAWLTLRQIVAPSRTMVRVIFVLLTFEVLVGGGGRLLEIGPVTARMLLFAAALLLTVVTVALRGTLPGGRLTLMLLSAFLFVLSSGVVVGLSRGNSSAAVWADLQPLLFFLLAPFVALSLEDRRNVEALRPLVVVAGLTLAFLYIGVLVLLIAGRIDFSWLYEVLDASGEFMFRGENFFFYKGFVYLGVCVVFLIAVPGRFALPFLAVTGIALVLTLTRGFIISTTVAVLMLLYVLRMRLAAVLLAIACAAALLVAFVVLYSSVAGFSEQRSISNAVRMDDMAFIFGNVGPLTMLFGNGFGTPVAERLNIENTYLWVLWKNGLVGLAFWLAPLLACIVLFSRIPRRAAEFRLGCALLFSAVLIYVQSAMNPYLNNPIGLMMVMIALFGLRELSAGQRRIAGAVPQELPEMRPILREGR